MDAPTTLRVATANLASGAGGDGWPAALAGLDVDVLALQEVDHLLDRSGRRDQTAEAAAACAGDGPPWRARFAAAVHGTPGRADTFAAAASSAPATQAGVPSYGVALLTRHPVLRWVELRMPPSRARLPVPLPPGAGARVLWAPDEQRVALAAVVAAPLGEVTVVCTHLSFAPHRAVGQLRALRVWARDLPRPLLLLGDLNLPGRLPARRHGVVRGRSGAHLPRGRPARAARPRAARPRPPRRTAVAADHPRRGRQRPPGAAHGALPRP